MRSEDEHQGTIISEGRTYHYVWAEALSSATLRSLGDIEQSRYEFVRNLSRRAYFENIRIEKVYFLVFEKRLWHFVIPDSRAERQSFIASSIALLESFAVLKGWQWGLFKGLLKSINFDRVALPNFMAATHTEVPQVTKPEWIALKKILSSKLSGYTLRWAIIYNDELIEWISESEDVVTLETSTAEIKTSQAAYDKILDRYRRKYANGMQKALNAGLISSEIIRLGDGAERLSSEDCKRIVEQYNGLYNIKYNKGNAATFNEDYVRFIAGRYSHLLLVRDSKQQVVGGIFYNFAFYKHYLINWVFYDAEFSQNFRSGGATVYTYIMFTAVLDVLKEKLSSGDSQHLNISNGVLDYKKGNFYAEIYPEKLIFDFSNEVSWLRRLMYRVFASTFVQKKLRG